MIRKRGWSSGLLTFSLMLTGLSFAVSGCDSEKEIQTGVPGAAKLLKEEDLYRYEGTGTAKKKVMISMDERRKLLLEAGEKLKSK
jgi:hypothetical protein